MRDTPEIFASASERLHRSRFRAQRALRTPRSAHWRNLTISILLARLRRLHRKGGAHHGCRSGGPGWQQHLRSRHCGLVGRARTQVYTNQVRGFRYFAEASHAQCRIDSRRDAILNPCVSRPTALAIFMISGGGSSIVEKPVVTVKDTMKDSWKTTKFLCPILPQPIVRSSFGCAHRRDQRHSQTFRRSKADDWRRPLIRRSRFQFWSPTCPTDRRRARSGPTMPDPRPFMTASASREIRPDRATAEIGGRSVSSACACRDAQSDDPAFVRARGGPCSRIKSPSTKPPRLPPAPGRRRSR